MIEGIRSKRPEEWGEAGRVTESSSGVQKELRVKVGMWVPRPSSDISCSDPGAIAL